MTQDMESDMLMDMLSARTTKLGDTFFHEVCEAKSYALLRRAAEFIEEPITEILDTINYNGEQCVHLVVKGKSPWAVPMMQILTDLGANLNGNEGYAGFTPLHLCVMEKNYQVAEWLCGEPSVNLEARNYEGLTAYQLAFRREEHQIMEILKKAGSDCEPPSSEDSLSSDYESDESSGTSSE